MKIKKITYNLSARVSQLTQLVKIVNYIYIYFFNNWCYTIENLLQKTLKIQFKHHRQLNFINNLYALTKYFFNAYNQNKNL